MNKCIRRSNSAHLLSTFSNIEDSFPSVYEKNPVPKIIQMMAKKRSSVECGSISPYPTVVRVCKLHSKAAMYFVYIEARRRPLRFIQVSSSKSDSLAKKYQKQATRWLINKILNKSTRPLITPSLIPRKESVLANAVLFLVLI